MRILLAILALCGACYGWGVAGIGSRPATSGPDANTVLLLHFNGTDATIVDSCASAHTIAVYGNATQSATQSKFGGKALALDGTGDYVAATDNYSQFSWTENGAATCDFWAYFSATDANRWLIEDGGYGHDLYYTGGVIYSRLTAGPLQWAWTPTADTWYHMALVKGAAGYDSIALYVDGTAITRTSGTATGGFTCQGALRIGSRASDDFAGYIDEFRWSNVARWSGNFTPPTAEY